MPEDFYDLFGVDEDANRDTISNAYRDLVRDYHPDNNDADNARDQFKTIRIAREVLMDEDSRDRYDTYGHARYVDNFVDQDLSGFEFTAEPQYTMDDPGPTPSNQQSTSSAASTEQTTSTDTSSETTNAETEGITTEEQTISADPDVDATEEATINVEADDYDGPDISDNVYTNSDGSSTIVFKPKVNQSIINMSWLVVATFAAYLIGIGAYIRDNQAAVGQIVSEGLVLQPERNGLPTLTSVVNDVIAAPAADPLLVLIPVGILFLPLSIGVTVARFGTTSTWLYALGALPPAGLLAYEALAQPVAPTIEAIVFVGIPFIVTFAFITDILGRIIVQYLKYYWYQYGP